jgi:3-deoxy-7-phosphoheptulonate synthase
MAPHSGDPVVMIVMDPRATAADAARVAELLDATGAARARVLRRGGGLSVAVAGEAERLIALGLEALPGVQSVVALERPYKLASAELSPFPGGLTVAGRRLGPDTFCLIAGPCTVESRGQTLHVADAVAPWASMLRGGAFKPRTSPFAFRGLGEAALDILAEARRCSGLPIVTEMTDSRNADRLADVADVIQIGARNMQNYALLEVAGALGKPVLLKRGLSSTLDELLMAADYVLNAGTEEVVLCERGIRTFERATRFTLDLGAVPWLKLHTHLPVIVDPSHAAGDRRLVEALACGAAAVGADGIIVEVHGDPETARCDAAQQLHAHQFGAFAERVLAFAALAGRSLAGPGGVAAVGESLNRVASLA